jgi:5'-nucleotidase
MSTPLAKIKGPVHASTKIRTCGSEFFDLVNPRPEDVNLRHIAHALSLLCRFSGSVDTHYSVAEHSIRVMKLLPKDHAIHGLFHDAAEAYTGDITSPMKNAIGRWTVDEIEERILRTIYQAFQIEWPRPSVWQKVHIADKAVLIQELREWDVREPLSAWRAKGAWAAHALDFMASA